MLQGVSANVGIFSKDGVLINYAGGGYSNVAPLTNPPPTARSWWCCSACPCRSTPSYGEDFAPNTVVAVTSRGLHEGRAGL